MCKWDKMGPSVVDTVEDLRNIQQSLWEVSPAGSTCSITHDWLQSKTAQSVTDIEKNLPCCFCDMKCCFNVKTLSDLCLCLSRPKAN